MFPASLTIFEEEEVRERANRQSMAGVRTAGFGLMRGLTVAVLTQLPTGLLPPGLLPSGLLPPGVLPPGL